MYEFIRTDTMADGTTRSVVYSREPIGLDIPEEFLSPFTEAVAEAQFLEAALKKAIGEDVAVFAAENHVEILRVLETATLGRSLNILTGDATRNVDKIMARCIGFFRVLLGYTSSCGSLEDLMSDILLRRNYIAHDFFNDFFKHRKTKKEAVDYLHESLEKFIYLRVAVIQASDTSTHVGSLISNGSDKRIRPEI